MPKRIDRTVKERVRERVAETRSDPKPLSVDKLLSELHRQFGPEAISRTGVYNEMKRARQAIKRHVPPGRPWDPSPLEWPPDAYLFLLALNRHCTSGVLGDNDAVPDMESRQLTAQEARWGGRLHRVLESAPNDVAYELVSTFAYREFMAETYDHPMELSDLVGYLEYRPWESRDAEETYALACRLGRVPKVGNVDFSLDDLPAESDQMVKIDVAIDVEPSESLSYIERESLERLGKPEQLTVRQLQLVHERARMVQAAATERLQVLWDSGFEETDTQDEIGE